jgi:hypothetical protein
MGDDDFLKIALPNILLCLCFASISGIGRPSILLFALPLLCHCPVSLSTLERAAAVRAALLLLPLAERFCLFCLALPLVERSDLFCPCYAVCRAL